jgi:hypothetical protein
MGAFELAAIQARRHSPMAASRSAESFALK